MWIPCPVGNRGSRTDTHPASAQSDEAIRGKTAMSVYVSVTGDSEIYAAGIRLSIEQQLHEIGITVLPHADPPNFPVLNLTIGVETQDAQVTELQNGSPVKSYQQKYLRSGSRLELRQLAAGQTREMRPIKDEAIWTLAGKTEDVGLIDSWKIGLDALDLVIVFVHKWIAVNGRRAATTDVPMATPNPSTPFPPSSEPGQALHQPSCPRKEGGGCVVAVSLGVTGSVYSVPASQRDMVTQQIESQKNRNQMVITCEYGPANPQAGTGFVTFHFWYQSAPPDILRLLTSTYPHPFMELGRVAVAACPATKALASQINASRFN